MNQEVVNTFFKNVLTHYKQEDHSDLRKRAYEILGKEQQYIEIRRRDEEKICELQEEIIDLKTELELYKNTKIKEIGLIEKHIEGLELNCIDLEKKGQTKQLRLAEKKLNELKKRLS